MKTSKFLFFFFALCFTCFAGKKEQDLKCLSQAVYWEARGESDEGKIAVANVVMNRYEKEKYNSVCEVIKEKGQFGWVGKKKRIVEKKSWEKANLIAESVYNHEIKDNVNGARWFHEKRVHPSWARKRTIVARIGNHYFYK